jgi:hypothetical protein
MMDALTLFICLLQAQIFILFFLVSFLFSKLDRLGKTLESMDKKLDIIIDNTPTENK